MESLQIKYFGDIPLQNFKEYYDCDIELNEKNISIDLNFNTSQEIDKERVAIVDNFLKNLKSENEEILKLLNGDFREKGLTKDYCEIIIDSFEDDIDELLENTNKKLSKIKRVLSLINLKRVGCYLDKDDKHTIVCDYTVNQEMTDELLVVCLDTDLNITYITIES